MELLRDRNSLRKTIRTDMQKVCNGWGVWLETVEITEVLIASTSLFKDLQADFREKMHQKAQLIKMEVDAELNKFKEIQNLEMNKVRAEHKAEVATIIDQSNQEIKDMQEKGQLEQAKIREEYSKMQNDLRTFEQELRTKTSLI